MEIKFMINWNEQEIASMEEYRNEHVLDLAHAYSENEDRFNRFLDDNYYAKEIFEMSDEQKTEVLNKFNDKCKADAEEDLVEDGWEICYLEI